MTSAYLAVTAVTFFLAMLAWTRLRSKDYPLSKSFSLLLVLSILWPITWARNIYVRRKARRAKKHDAGK